MTPPFQRDVTRDIRIRQFQPADAEPLFACVERNRAYLREWLPWVDATGGVEDISAFILRTQGQWEAGQGPQCSIWLRGELVGSIGTHPIDWNNRNCAVGYWLDAHRQGSGIVTRCCATLLDYLLLELDLNRVEIHCGTGNWRSSAIPQRLGFTREGVRRQAQLVGGRWLDMETWSLLADEWRAASASVRAEPGV
jgi:ribosomal-protein-serine acetyltransferase